MSALSGKSFDLSKYLVPAAEQLPSNAAYLVHLDILAKSPNLVRLQSNENTHPPSEHVRRALTEAYDTANLYASPRNPLRSALAERHQVSTDAILIGAGATEGIEATLRTFVRAGDHVVLASPTWPVYGRRFSALEASISEISMPAGPQSYRYPVDEMLAAITPRTKMVVIVTPNNPTGNLMAEADVCRFLETGCVVLLDQAYRDFAPGNDLTGLIHEYENLVVASTFAKSYSLAGLRLGYILAGPKLTDYIDRFMAPGGSVSSATLHAGLAALNDEAFHQQQVERIIAERERFIQAARRLGLRAFDSGGNFFAIDTAFYPGGAQGFAAAVLERGVLIRPLTENLVRVTIGMAQENDMAIRVFQVVIDAFNA
jgi:histidinol-phosphate aminotransferase